MELGRNLLSSSPPFPPRTHVRNCPSSLASMLHEQPASALTSLPTASLARHFPASVLQEQCDESRPLLHIMKEDRTSQITLDRGRMETGSLVHAENNTVDSDQYLKDFQHQLLNWPGLWYLLPTLQTGETISLTMQSVPSKTKKLMDVEPHNVVALAKKALSASKQAAVLTDSQLFGADLDESITPSLSSIDFANFPLEEEKTVRSTRHLERRSRKRKVPKPIVMVHETSKSRRADLKRKISEAFDPNDPLRLFLWGPETKQLLTVKEESELIVQIQDLMKLEEVRITLQSQFGREPTLVEWAEATGLSCQALQSQLRCGNSSREKLIFANFRMVVHIAKQYQWCGLNLQDLLQEGSMGLMRSVEKFKPQAGCRFASYAYWWIRQAVRKAIFRHSRTIRLPDNVYSLLHKVTEAKRLCIQEGHHQPTKEEIAARVGITVEKLERLLFSVRMPLSLQKPVWMDQNTTFQQITADTAIEMPDVSVAKQLMRQHIRNLLSILNLRERKIIRLRYGIEDGKPKSLSEIGAVFGLSKERVRQLESRAFYKLRQSLGSQGLDAYADLLV
uniref:RNA polymerase sigma factor n=1 Tax=Davidia involucrata TaxID=16924 RepID=A0A5B6YWT1_DAVIN